MNETAGYDEMLELLSQDDVERIHSAVVEILESIGVMMPHERALKILKESGADIDSKNKIARIPEHLIKETLSRAPKRYSLTARNPHFNIELGDGTPHFTNAYGAHYIIDLETGVRRPATLKDLEDFTRLSDYFQTVDYVKSNIIPQDVPRNIVEQKTALAEFRSTEKHCSANSMTPEGFRDVIKMAMILSGGEEEFRKNPSIIDAGFNNVPPLKYSADTIEMMLECAEYRIPFDITTGALSSASSPVTLAGTLAQGIAENHAAVVVTQLAGPGTPMSWGLGGSILDQRHGTAAYGAPENGLMHVAFAQMARYYGIPYYGAAGVIDSKVPDAQAAFENATNVLLATLAGADVVHDAVYGVLETGVTASHEQFAISNEMCGAVKRIARGIRVDTETLALDRIREVGHNENHLSVIGALRFTKKLLAQEHWQPVLFDRSTRSDWEERGSTDIVARARASVRNVLSSHQVQPLDKDIERAMALVIKRRTKKS